MKKELLEKYLLGEASEKERLEVLSWSEESESNKKELLSYRQLYNALIFNTSPSHKKNKTRSQIIFLRWTSIAAAIIIVGLLFGYHHYNNISLTIDTLSTPAGLISESILSDGTKVSLNAGSSIEILKSRKKERRVRLKGEGFFDVAKDSERPFIVETDNIYIKVTGTSFNVNETENSVVLVRGSVQIDSKSEEKTLSYKLKPGQIFIRNKHNGTGTISNIDTSKYTSWTNGFLQFDGTSIKDVLTRLEAFYNINIDASNINNCPHCITGKFDLRVRADTALANLEFLAPVIFHKISATEYKVMLK